MLRSPLKYFLFFLFLCSSAKAQTYDQLIDAAGKKYESKEYETSALLYEKAFRLDSMADPEYYYNAACSWALAGKDSIAFKDLKLALAHGYKDSGLIKTDPDIVSLRNKPQWKEIEDIFLSRKEEFEKRTDDFRPIYFWGMYLGILFVFFIYNLFLFFSLKDVTYLYYSLSILFLAHLHAIVIKPFGFFAKDLLFWLNYMEMTLRLSFFFACMMSVFHLLFIAKFLNLKENSPNLNKWNKYLIIYLSVISVWCIFIRLPNFIFFPSLLIVYIFSFTVGVLVWKKGFKPAKFLVIASVFLTVGVSLTLLNNLGIFHIKLNAFVFRADNIGCVLFYGLLSFALGDKINILKQEKLQAQEKALEVLEVRVQERTVEVVKQKEIIEEKQKEIIDSINYAKRIQQSLLPTQKYIAKCMERLRRK